jgi:uncharacterized protein YyaL (SSP411 family)
VLVPAGERTSEGAVSLYVCENQTCAPPVHDPDAAIELLTDASSRAG